MSSTASRATLSHRRPHRWARHRWPRHRPRHRRCRCGSWSRLRSMRFAALSRRPSTVQFCTIPVMALMAWYSVDFCRLLPVLPPCTSCRSRTSNQRFDVPDCGLPRASPLPSIAIGGGGALAGPMRVATASDMAAGSRPDFAGHRRYNVLQYFPPTARPWDWNLIISPGCILFR